MKKKNTVDQPPLIPDTPQVTIRSEMNEYPPGDSVDEYRNLKDANEHLAGKEIGQQNNNL
ncbi:hypothetical protein QYG89_10700 [Bacillus sp. B190/17]|uniref:Uncharacterized protein n=1 Tax=Bacillus lumedeiriae TaxID=3058829 RepID=A0ABW8IAG3_9BACI